MALLKSPYEMINSLTVIGLIKKEISESISREQKLNESAIGTSAYPLLMGYERQKIEILLNTCNELYGRRVTNKYVCRILGIENND